MNQISKYYKVLLALCELTLSIPLLGFSIVASSGWTVLGWMIVLHIIGILLSIATKQRKSGHILGVVSNGIAIIPFVGMFVHGVTGLVLLYQAFSKKQ